MNKNAFDIQKSSVTFPFGFKASGIVAGIKKSGKDLALVTSDVPAQCAAMFTTSTLPAACVLFSKEIVKNKKAQALIINSGNANACTGDQGYKDTQEMASVTAGCLGMSEDMVLVSSTGVIGVPLPMETVRSGIVKACSTIKDQGGIEAAEAIMTTDTYAKYFAVEFELDGKKARIGSMAKGSGMINPNMATMICVLTTDVDIDADMLQSALNKVIPRTLNALTIDGDMSTNDAVFLLANGQCGNKQITSKDENFNKFTDALESICLEITKALAADGEGATKFVTVTVNQANTQQEALKAAKEIANSMLVKTAIFGHDPNWGRVVAALGKSQAKIDPNAFKITFAGISVADNGQAIKYDKEKMFTALKNKEIEINVSLGSGSAEATVYTCDLTYDYVKINAEYTT